ncbi:hypothetical protein VTK73DRAFT_1911 [Phialemonium thermophilum]|uniref:Uncharacterized protein n=1 Tax=Phialemonium thermophilum TaxID=223376 RepID=A0ABR3Y3A1_9PEZI
MAPFTSMSGLPRQIADSVSSVDSAKIGSYLPERIHLEPTKTLKLVTDALLRRQTGPTATVTVVADGGNTSQASGKSSLSGGAIAGIVIGSVAGFLLLWWLIYSCTRRDGSPTGGRPGGHDTWYESVTEEAPPRSRSRSHHRRRKSSEMRYVRPVTVVAGNPAPPAYVYERDARDSRRGRRSHRSRSRY